MHTLNATEVLLERHHINQFFMHKEVITSFHSETDLELKCLHKLLFVFDLKVISVLLVSYLNLTCIEKQHLILLTRLVNSVAYHK